VGKWEGKEKENSGKKKDLKSSSSQPLHAQGRRRTMSFKTALFPYFFFKKRKCNLKKPKKWVMTLMYIT
jgi:hypothetical protein